MSTGPGQKASSTICSVTMGGATFADLVTIHPHNHTIGEGRILFAFVTSTQYCVYDFYSLTNITRRLHRCLKNAKVSTITYFICTFLVYLLKGPIVSHWNVMWFTFE